MHCIIRLICYIVAPNIDYLLVFTKQAGLSKLNEATALVDELKQKAAEQSILLAQKQAEADEALKEITVSMQVR